MATMKTITAQDFRAMVEIGEMRLSENAEFVNSLNVSQDQMETQGQT